MTAPNPFTLPQEAIIGGETKTIRLEGDYTAASTYAVFILLNYVSKSETPALTREMTVESGAVSIELAAADTRRLYGKYIYQITVANASGQIDVKQGILFIYRNAANQDTTPQETDTFRIHYVSAYGTAPADKSVSVWHGSGYTLTAADLPTLSADGYRFDGWNKEVGDTISADTTITASWTEIQYVNITLTYVSAHGTTPNPKQRRYEAGGSYILTASDLPTLSDEGYIFLGWDRSVGDEIEDDCVIEASWAADERSVVYYGIGTPANKNDMPVFQSLSHDVYTPGSSFTFTTQTGIGQYSYFAYPTALGSVGFRYMFPDEGSWWSGGYTRIGTTTLDDISYTVYRSTNANLGQMTTSVTIT